MKLTVTILAEEFGFNYIPGSHNLMTNGKDVILDVYGSPIKYNGNPVNTVDDLKNILEVDQTSFQEDLQKKTKKK